MGVGPRRKVAELRPDMGRKVPRQAVATLWPKHQAKHPGLGGFFRATVTDVARRLRPRRRVSRAPSRQCWLEVASRLAESPDKEHSKYARAHRSSSQSHPRHSGQTADEDKQVAHRAPPFAKSSSQLPGQIARGANALVGPPGPPLRKHEQGPDSRRQCEDLPGAGPDWPGHRSRNAEPAPSPELASPSKKHSDAVSAL